VQQRHSRPQHQLHHRHHLQHRHQHHHGRNRGRCPGHVPHVLCQQAILTIAQWMPWSNGVLARRLGAARFTTRVAHPLHHQQLFRSPCQLCRSRCQLCQLLLWPHPGPQTLTIVRMDMQIGRWVGLWERRRGAAKFMVKDALARLDVRQHRSPTTVLQDTLIGWQGGVSARRRGAAKMRARAARQQLEDVLS